MKSPKPAFGPERVTLYKGFTVYSGLTGQAPMGQHRADIWVFAVKGPEHGPVVQSMAPRQDQVTETLAIGAREAPMGGESGIGVIGQHHGPLIGVVARG